MFKPERFRLKKLKKTIKASDLVLTLPQDEAEFWIGAYSKADVILEYGSGGYTMAAARLGKYVTAAKSDPAWAANMNRVLREGGKWNAAALYDRTHSLRQDRYAAEGKAATANAFMRRKVFNAIGLFDARLLTGGDHEWSLRAERAGFALAYCPAAAIRHPARSSFLQLLYKARRFAGGRIAKTRERGDKIIIPYFDNLLPPIRRGLLLLRSRELAFLDAMRVWFVLYAIRVAVFGEQVHLILFRGKYERR